MNPLIQYAGDTIYRFGAFELFARRQLLVHAGSPVTIGSRALALLSRLIEREGALVSKDELLAAAWPNIFVHDGNLKVSISGLRRALSAHDPRQDYIASVPGRGYRFVGPVRREASASVTYTSAVQCASLPAAIALVGREDEVEAVAKALGTNRIVTIIGTGGVGKTAIAIAAAHRVAARFAQGASFVDLASVTDPRHLTATISAELGVRSDNDDLLAAVVHALRDEHRLLVFDNCEHLMPAIAAAVDRLAAALPHTAILATSREPLRLAREQVLRIAPLSCPPPGDRVCHEPEATLGFPAVELFVQRAREATGRAVESADLPAVADICNRLDGIPLALELAAARCDHNSTAALLTLLQNRFEFLDQGDSTKPARQRALRATLQWSYGLLRPQEAAILRSLAVFARAFTIEDALAIAQVTAVAPVEALESVASLISKSLLSPDGREDGLGYRLLQSTRAFATDLLNADPDRMRIQQRHAEHVCVALQRASERQPSGADGQTDLSRWTADVRRALAWAFSDEGSDLLGIGLTIAAIPMWESLSLLDESITHLTAAIARCRGDAPEDLATEIRLQIALTSALFYAGGLTSDTEAALERALRLSRHLGQVEFQMTTLWGCGVQELHAARPIRTVELMRLFAELAPSLSDPSIVPDGERLMAAAELYLGRLKSAAARLEKVPMLGDRAGRSPARLMFQLHRDSAAGGTFALVKWLQGDRAGAAELAERTIAAAVTSGHPVSVCNAIVQHALLIAILDGRLDDGQRYVELLRVQCAGGRLRWWAQIARCSEAALAMRHGEPDGLARLQHAIVDGGIVGTSLRLPAFMGMLAEDLAVHGRLAEAWLTINDALSRATLQQELWIVPELRRIVAGIQLRQGLHVEAEASLAAAIDLADAMNAESWRTRASADLARLRGDRDCRRTLGRQICSQ